MLLNSRQECNVFRSPWVIPASTASARLAGSTASTSVTRTLARGSRGSLPWSCFLLNTFPRKRSVLGWHWGQALELPWLELLSEASRRGSVMASANMDTPINISTKLRKFMSMCHFKRVALNVIAQQLTEADIGARGS